MLVVKRGPNAGCGTSGFGRVDAIRRAASRQRHLSRRRQRQPTGDEFRRENGEYLVVDTGSLNGTYVNRKPVESVALANGDEIQMGKFRLVFLTRPTTH